MERGRITMYLDVLKLHAINHMHMSIYLKLINKPCFGYLIYMCRIAENFQRGIFLPFRH